jgi:lambda repressor-like predicted transcriptional regulator
VILEMWDGLKKITDFTMTTSTLQNDIQKLQLLQATKFLRAYLECSDQIQAAIREMLDILNDPETDEDDRDMTLFTLADSLFPDPHESRLGMNLDESERVDASSSEEMRQALDEMDKEEEMFAERLRAIMEEKGLTQTQLAESLKIGQSAISNMLHRQCRPQRRTVLRIAEALGVDPGDLWPAWHT